jgi:hypothetical protein
MVLFHSYLFKIFSIIFLLPLTVAASTHHRPAKYSSRLPHLDSEIFSTGTDSSSFTIPFSRAGNLIVIQGKVDTLEGNFVLDTGCPGLVLNLTYFRNYKMEESNTEGTGITGSEFSVAHTEMDSFSFGSAHYYHLSTDLANLGNIENTKGIKILGLIGVELLKQFELIIDYDKNQLQVRRIGRKNMHSYHNELLDDSSAYTVVPISISDNRIIVQTILAGKKIKLILDSGAESNLLDSRLPNKVFENVSITGRSLLSGAGQNKIEVVTGNLEELSFGSRSIKNLPVVIANLEKTCFAYGGCIDGVLGFDFLSLKKLGFNFVTNKMYIWK